MRIQKPIFNQLDQTNHAVDTYSSQAKPLAEELDSVYYIEGFPIANKSEILDLSNPPYYTACPSPYLSDFVAHYGREYDETTDTYSQTPFVGDVSEGKNDPIYRAHSYHTKVPPKAIMRYIEHYTEPGDIVCDGFCGSGMTGVAAQMLGRRAILSDLSPVASFIAYNYNTQLNAMDFEREAKRLLSEIKSECQWMYETLHSDGKTVGKVHYTIWSDVFVCSYCKNEFVYWDAAVDKQNGKVSNEFSCPTCRAKLTKKAVEPATVQYYDTSVGYEMTQTKQEPVLISYSVGGNRYEKVPDKNDRDLLKTIERGAIPYWYPTDRMPVGDKTGEPTRTHGITHVHHFYPRRNLWTLASYYDKAKSNNSLLFALSGVAISTTKMYRYTPDYEGGGPLSGTLYVPSILREISAIDALERFLKKLVRFHKTERSFSNCLIQTCSASAISAPTNSVDYIFTDPPFGYNLMYSELNFLWESWLKVKTNNHNEAIINSSQNKGLDEYKQLMTQSFQEMYRILKPNRWITVEFHNSKASVWNAIQDSMTKAGFVVAQVSVLTKQQGSFNQITASGAVKNDLVINAYKPVRKLEEHFLKRAGNGVEWEFVQDILNHLPTEPHINRTEHMLYSKMLANYVQYGFEIRLNSRQFYQMLRDNFKIADGYWFTDEQVLEYDEWKRKQGLSRIKEIKTGQSVIFVSDERSALVWLYHFMVEPKTYSDIFTAYHQVVLTTEDAIPELRELLDSNFISEGGNYRRPLSEKEKEIIEEQRERDLDRTFGHLLSEASKGNKKLKNVRREAVFHGFTKAYQAKRFSDILVVAKKLDNTILENNSELNDFVEVARIKMGEEN